MERRPKNYLNVGNEKVPKNRMEKSETTLHQPESHVMAPE
jgi:hypothetical protein